MAFPSGSKVILANGQELDISMVTPDTTAFDYLLEAQTVVDTTSFDVSAMDLAVVRFLSWEVVTSPDQQLWVKKDNTNAWIDATSIVPGDLVASPTSGPEKPWMFFQVDSTDSTSYTGTLHALSDTSSNSFVVGVVCAKGL